MNKNDYENIKKIIDEYRYISFDLFDTLVTRNLPNPTDVFSFLSKDKKDWKSKRINAEKLSRNSTEHEEINIQDIYKHIDGTEKEIREQIFKEEQLEIELSTSIKFTKLILEYCYSKKKKILITSDMYLNKNTIIKILEKNRIKYDKLYLSSEIKLTKETGNLFTYVLNDLNITSDQLLHIGDNYQSDYCTPMMMGIRAINIKKYIPKVNNKLTKKDKFSCKCLNLFINNNLSYEQNYFYRKGYETFGPLLYGYCKWLDENFEKKDYDNILFLSRDGYIMKKAYEIISNKETKYMYASRRALIVPTLWKCKNLDEIKKSMNIPRVITIEALLEKFGLESKKYQKIIEKYNLTLSTELKEKDITEKKLEFYKEIEKDIYINSKKEYKEMINYFKENNIDKKTAIVDIGWHGNMQNAIFNIIQSENLNIELDGYYVGVAPHSEKQKRLSMNGYLFSKKEPDLYYNELFFNSLFELIFMAPHGSVKKYVKDGVELYPFEYENSLSKKEIDDFHNCSLI